MDGRNNSWRNLRPPPGLLGALALVLIAEAGFSRVEREFGSYTALNAVYAASQASRGVADGRVLLLGDSQVKFGLDPRRFEQSGAGRAVNLAIAGAPPPASYLVLKRALEAGARPAAVVVGHMTLAGSIDRQRDAVLPLVGPREAADLAWAFRDASLFGRLLTARTIPSVRLRDPTRAAVLATLKGGPATLRPAARHFRDAWAASAGAEVRPGTTASSLRLNEELADQAYARPWFVEPGYGSYLRRTFELAARHKIPAYLLVAPIAPAAQAKRDALGLDAKHTVNLRAVLARHPEVVVIDARRVGFRDAEFFDVSHLNGEGADRLSAMVAETLHTPSPREVAGRWVELGRDQPGRRLGRLPERSRANR